MRKLLFFCADWCSPCKFYKRITIDPLIETVGVQRVQIIDVQNTPFLASKYFVDKLPTIIVLDGDKVLLNSTGGYTVEQLKELLKEND